MLIVMQMNLISFGVRIAPAVDIGSLKIFKTIFQCFSSKFQSQC